MKKLILAATILGVIAMNAPTAKAGDREWATVGKVLTGVAAAGIIAHAIDSHASVAVSMGFPAPVVCAPAPAVVYAPPPRVIYAPAPVIYRAPRIVYRGYDHRDHWDNRYGHGHDDHRR